MIKSRNRNSFEIGSSQVIVIRTGGERGIRTLGTNNSYNGLAIRRFRPLSHLSQFSIANFYVM